MADGLYTIITKRLQWIDNAANRTISGKFRVNTNLRRIDLINKGLDAFTIKVGTTNGGSEIAEADIAVTDETYTLIIHQFFDSDTTVYITGIDTAQLNLFVIFDQDDEENINISGGTSGVYLFPQGFEGYFPEMYDGHLEACWDLASGLGKPNTRYSNCAIRDGRNGTNNDADTFDIGVAIANTVALQTLVGQNSTVLTIPNLPPNPIPFGTDLKGGAQGVKVLSVDVPGPKGQITKDVGGTSVPIDNRPRSRYKLPFIAITD